MTTALAKRRLSQLSSASHDRGKTLEVIEEVMNKLEFFELETGTGKEENTCVLVVGKNTFAFAFGEISAELGIEPNESVDVVFEEFSTITDDGEFMKKKQFTEAVLFGLGY